MVDQLNDWTWLDALTAKFDQDASAVVLEQPEHQVRSALDSLF